MERIDDKYYAFVFQYQRSANDPYIINMVKTVLENFNVHALYLEDRDNNMSHNFRIVPGKPSSSKFSRMTSLINTSNLIKRSKSCVIEKM